MKKILLVASHGGHLSELRALKKAWEGCDVRWASYPSPNSKEIDYSVKHIGMNPFKMLTSFFVFFKIIYTFRPDYVISTGSEIAIPAMFWAKLFSSKTLYIECSARVSSASLAGKLLYRWVDTFWVQWPHNTKSFGDKAEYHGGTL